MTTAGGRFTDTVSENARIQHGDCMFAMCVVNYAPMFDGMAVSSCADLQGDDKKWTA